MRDVFSHYDELDVKRGLLATIAMFRKIAMETAARLKYPYPEEADEHVADWIEARFKE